MGDAVSRTTAIRWIRVFTNRSAAFAERRARGVAPPAPYDRAPLCSRRSRTSARVGDARPSRRSGARSGGSGASVLDVHSDADHNRSVFTLVGEPQELADALVAGGARGGRARSTCASTKALTRASARSTSRRSSTCAARTASSPRTRRSRSRTGSPASSSCPCSCTACWRPSPSGASASYFREGASERSRSGSSRASWSRTSGRAGSHPTAGATLVACRPPLVAFNLELAEPDLDAREGDRGRAARGRRRPAGVRAIGVMLDRAATAQVSMNVQDPFAVPLAEVVRAAREAAAPRGVTVRAAELVGLAPAAALDGFPDRPRAEGLRRAQARAREAT